MVAGFLHEVLGMRLPAARTYDNILTHPRELIVKMPTSSEARHGVHRARSKSGRQAGARMLWFACVAGKQKWQVSLVWMLWFAWIHTAVSSSSTRGLAESEDTVATLVTVNVGMLEPVESGLALVVK